MRLPVVPVASFEDCTLDFEALQRNLGPVVVTGSRAGNAALASLLTALAAMGLIVNNTTP